VAIIKMSIATKSLRLAYPNSELIGAKKRRDKRAKSEEVVPNEISVVE